MSDVLDPTTVRLSDSILLSDLLGCYSVYRYGYSNKCPAASGAHVKEAKKLCTELLEPLMAKFGPCSFSYGYLSPRLSRAIVKYQDPNKPSYHRWDLGAAVDAVFHDRKSTPPIHTAHEIDAMGIEYARMITYSESPFMCLATSKRQGDRRAFYENRYIGKKQPLYIRKPESAEARKVQHADIVKRKLARNWRGAGYPTYHGGGILQYQHLRTSKYTVLSDFLYDRDAVQLGKMNAPNIEDLHHFGQAGQIIDLLVTHLRKRISIVSAFTAKEPYRTRFVMELVPPASVRRTDIADLALTSDMVAKVSMAGTNRVRIIGVK